ncbi:FkbM family methyltransferase [Mycobacterium florentinum]|uniref:FkbM family methyltransferase n=1 Tax=Mycobacterium florentinum TaxID=292462 RepID=A0A1X1U863_MYCFL|nr:FkbM family methyltransferase [Mycobacterium florentinum]MCV7409585.1 FkbM family methyltransferase [Mycobacterium florentinum]ORV52918.1 FkbM family methyltransferase [Mycobacterium florentinum]
MGDLPDGDNKNSALWNLLAPQRLTDVIDVGANPIDTEPPYTSMLSAGLCRVTGFEPQLEALQKLQESQGPHERYLPYVVGDGGAHTLNVYRGSGFTSLFELDPAALDIFEYIKLPGQLVERVPVQSRRLDDIAEIHHVDLLKIDVQGGELAVFRGGTARLAEAVAIQTEVSFVTLYKDQPTLGDIDSELRSQGFLPHCFPEIKLWPISPFVDPRQPTNQVLEADLVYVRDFTRPNLMSNEQLKHLALIAHHCYRSFDLALRCAQLLEYRQAAEPGIQQRYLAILAAG